MTSYHSTWYWFYMSSWGGVITIALQLFLSYVFLSFVCQSSLYWFPLFLSTSTLKIGFKILCRGESIFYSLWTTMVSWFSLLLSSFNWQWLYILDCFGPSSSCFLPLSTQFLWGFCLIYLLLIVGFLVSVFMSWWIQVHELFSMTNELSRIRNCLSGLFYQRSEICVFGECVDCHEC